MIFYNILVLIFLTMNTFSNNERELEKVVLGGGCFWCTEAVFKGFKGVVDVVPGYSGGHVKNPSYKEVCTGKTGHAEVIRITYDPSMITFPEILEVFFMTHDPTTLNKQGNDTGTQYRSAIFYNSEKQKETVLEIIEKISKEEIYKDPIVTEVTPFDTFYPAEDYHYNYFEINKNQPYCQFVITPKLEKFKKIFKDKLK
jgi:peptide-methionine (S)-S-oxide reductase